MWKVQQHVVIGAVLAWCVLVAIGVHTIFAYSTTAGAKADAPATWPASTKLARAGHGATVLMFVHPECPCTRASLHELDAIKHTALASTEILVVEDREEAARFGARTSGHVVVYDAAGMLQFSGGITGSRGHIGDNVGRETVARLARGEPVTRRDHAVFGCALEAP